MKETIPKQPSLHHHWKYAFVAPLLLGMLLVIHKPVSALAQDDKGSVSLNKSPDSKADNCRTLLGAVKANDVAEVKGLLKTVDPNCVYQGDGEPRSPLVAAARNGNLVMGKLLISAQANVAFHAPGDETPLMAAATGGHLDFVRYLVENGAAVNKKLSGEGTALIVAARSGHVAVVEYLIAQGAEINGQVDGDGTPLIVAARNGHRAVAQLLLENGADPYQVSPGDEYAMHHATVAEDQSMIDLLRKYAKKN